MNLFDPVVEALTFQGPPRADQDHSIVGKSPMEERTSRFWRRLAFTLSLAAGTAALIVWGA